MIGRKIGPYEVVAKLGEGGMGEVYRARDTKLGRDIALKVLPDLFAQDPERLARFRREAQVLASLNHPHIAQIYGIEDASGVTALAMELVDGGTLADRIARGPVPREEALSIARQIAEALAAAHEHGIVHRDLKPANISVTDDGVVKVLDFGLAKALEPEGSSTASGGAMITNSPTLTSPAATAMGMILGTAAYMAPEQAKGQRVDKRADIWAFGCVLYEMLTGKRAFEGDDVSEVLASVLAREPKLTALAADTPPVIRTVIERCLTKDRKQRLADISIALFLLNDAAALAPPPVAVAAPRQRRTGLLLTTAALGLGAGAALALVAFPVANRSAVAPSGTTRTSILLPADRPLAVSQATPSWLLAISPDGATVAYVSLNMKAAPAQRRQITLRSLASRTTRDLPGAVGAFQPAFSPDGSWIAYFTGSGELKKVALSGGNPVTIASKIVSSTYGSEVWLDANTIVFGGIGTGLTQVSADGSAQRTIAPLNTAEGEDRHLPLAFVPEARAVIFKTPSHLEALDLDTGKRRVVNDSPVFGAPVGDHLLFRRDDALLVAPFDRKSLAISGAAVPVAEDILNDGPGGLSSTPQVAVSANGTLAYVPAGNASIRVPGTVGRDGAFTPIGVDPGYLSRPRVSPDGQHVLLLRGIGADQSVPVYDMARGTTSFLLRNERGRIGGPVWRPPNGAQIALYLQRPGANGLYLMDLNGKEQLILKTDPSITWLRPESFSPDGSVLAYTQQKGGQFDIWTMSVADPQSARSFITAAATAHSPKFSPNGRWLAYVSTDSGRAEVYVRGYPSGGSVPVSSTGAQGPVWSRDGQTLFFEGGTATGPMLMSVSVTEAAGTLKLGPATVVLNQRVPSPSGGIEEYIRGAVWGAEFDVFPDGRFVTLRGPDPQGFREIVLVQNWFEELKRLAPR